VRDAEAIAKAEAKGAGRVARPRVGSLRASAKDADTLALEKALGDTLGLAVTIDHRSDGGELKIRYASLDQLDELCRRLRG
jgi:ParB family chromosome partitioning protein